MRKLVLVLFVLLLAIAAALVFAVANLDDWVNENREVVAERVEAAIGRPVRFGQVGLSLLGGIALRIDDLRVGEDRAFGKGDFLSAGTVDVRVRIWPALSGRIEVARVIVRDPKLEVIQTARGLSIESIGGTPGGGTGGGASPALALGLVEIRNGELHYVDRTTSPPDEARLTGLDVRLSDIDLDAAIPAARVTVRSPSGELIQAPYQDLAVDLRVRDGALEIERLDANVFDGSFRAEGRYELAGARPAFGLKAKLSGVRAGQLLAERSGGPPLLTGTLDADLALDGRGSGWPEIQKSLVGTGSMNIEDGVLKQLNPAGTAMQALMALPRFGAGGLSAFLRAHPKVFGAEDTPFSRLDAKFEVKDGEVEVREARLDTDEYVLTGRGRYSLDTGKLDFRSVMTFSDSVSEELVAAEPALRYTRGQDGRVELPVALRGAPPKVAALPDVSHLAGTAAREAIGDALRRAIGGGKEPAPPAEGAPAEQPPPAAGPRPEDVGVEILQRGLEGLLGGGKRE